MNKGLIKQLFCLLFFIAIISFCVIYFTIDIDNIKKLTLFSLDSILLALFFLFVGLFFDGTRLVHLVKVTDETITPAQAMKVVFSNYFLALLTPGATGGAVAQVMFLRRAGVPVGKATVVVLVRTLLSILFLIFVVPLVLHYDNMLVPWLSKDTLYLLSVLLIASTLFSIALIRTRYPDYLLLALCKRISFLDKRKVFYFYREIKLASLLFFKNPVSIIRVFFESGLSLLFIYSVVPILFYCVDPDINMIQVMGRMILLNLFLYFAPTPGGAGIAEGGFVMFFKPLLPAGTVGIMAIVWRIMVEYLPFLIGAYFSVYTFGPDIVARINSKANKINTKGAKL